MAADRLPRRKPSKNRGFCQKRGVLAENGGKAAIHLPKVTAAFRKVMATFPKGAAAFGNWTVTFRKAAVAGRKVAAGFGKGMTTFWKVTAGF
jgi:hypothetical protein